MRREFPAWIVAADLGLTVQQVNVLAQRGRNRWELRHRGSFTREELLEIVDDFVERL